MLDSQSILIGPSEVIGNTNILFHEQAHDSAALNNGWHGSTFKNRIAILLGPPL